MAAFVTRLQPMMVAHPSRSSATGAIDNSPGGSYRHWPHTHTGRTSFDHLVSSGEQRIRHSETERLCSLVVDHQLVLGRLLEGQIASLLATQDTINIRCGASVLLNAIRAVGDQAAGRHEYTLGIDRR